MIELLSKLGKPIGFGHADPKDALAHVGLDETKELVGNPAQHLPRRLRAVDAFDRGAGLFLALASRDLHEQKALVREVAVEGCLGHTGGAGNVIDTGAFESVTQEDFPRTIDHLVELAAFSDSRLSGLLSRIRLG